MSVLTDMWVLEPAEGIAMTPSSALGPGVLAPASMKFTSCCQSVLLNQVMSLVGQVSQTSGQGENAVASQGKVACLEVTFHESLGKLVSGNHSCDTSSHWAYFQNEGFRSEGLRLEPTNLIVSWHQQMQESKNRQNSTAVSPFSAFVQFCERKPCALIIVLLVCSFEGQLRRLLFWLVEKRPVRRHIIGFNIYSQIFKILS